MYTAFVSRVTKSRQATFKQNLNSAWQLRQNKETKIIYIRNERVLKLYKSLNSILTSVKKEKKTSHFPSFVFETTS